MDTQELKRLVREQYPFPIAHAHKKTLGVLDDNVEKLKCLLETAEVTIQFLALLALAQVRQDLRNHNAPNPGHLKNIIDLRNPSFGKWYGLTRDLIRQYRDHKEQLLIPEFFDFWFRASSRKKPSLQPLHSIAIEPLLSLRNDFHHGRVPPNNVEEKVREGLDWLHQLLTALQFLSSYELSFTQRITLSQDSQQHTSYIHDLTLFNGCLYETSRRQFDIHLQPASVIFFHPDQGKHLILNPFIIYAAHLKGPDIFLLNNVTKNKLIYGSSQFVGEELATKDDSWKDGSRCQEELAEFLEHLQSIRTEAAVIEKALPAEESPEEISPSTSEIFQQQYKVAQAAPQHISPYKFLDYYNPEDHDIFFGREKEIRFLQQKFYNSRLLVLHGESGSGKTSLIRAGLIPTLPSESYIPVYVRVLKEPLQEIKRELVYQLGLEGGSYSALEGNVVDLRPGEQYTSAKIPPNPPLEKGGTCSFPLAEFLEQVTERVSKTLIIVLDQFEEFFLRFPEEVRQQFSEAFAACIERPRLDVKFLISLRADYFSYLASFEENIPQIFTHQLQLERLTETQALEAVIKPAERLGISVDEPMVQIKLLPELLSEEGTIEPPLLQIVCDALYQNAQNEGRQEIGMQDYEAVGDVKGALGKYLDEKLRQFGKQQGMAKVVLKALVTAEGTKRASFTEELLSRIKSTFVVRHAAERSAVGEEQEERHSAALRASLQTITEEELQKDYLEKFVRDRLLRVEEVEGEARYELSHEYLVTHIEAWIEESEREVTKVLEVIDRAYEAYQTTDLLLENSALQMIKPFEDQLILPTEKQAFVDRSKTQVRKKRRGLLLKVAALLLFVTSVVGGVFGFQTYQAYLESEEQRQIAIAQQQEAEKQRQIAVTQQQEAELQRQKTFSNLLATQAMNLLDERYDQTLLLSVEASRGYDTFETRGSLLTALLHTPQLETMMRLGEPTLVAGAKRPYTSGLVFSHDGKQVFSISQSVSYRQILVWDTAQHTRINTLYNYHAAAVSLALSPDGKTLATSNGVLWDVTTGQQRAMLPVAKKFVAFSPDGRILASAEEGEILLWDVVSHEQIGQPLNTADRYINSLSFSPDGTILAVAAGNTIELWDLATFQRLAPLLKGHGDSVWKVVFHPDGTRLASGSRDKIILWDVVTRQPVKELLPELPEDPTYTMTTFFRLKNTGLAFSPDGKTLASSYERSIVLWDLETYEPRGKPLQGHIHSIQSLVFSPDGNTLASLGWDNMLILWNIAEPRLPGYPLHPEAQGEHLTFSPDGTLLACGTEEQFLVWDVTTQQQRFSYETGTVKDIAFSPDGKYIAVSSSGNPLLIFDVATFTARQESLPDDLQPPFLLAFVPGTGDGSTALYDGSYVIALGSQEGRIVLWDMENRRILRSFSLEAEAQLMDLIFSHDGKLLLAIDKQGKLMLWNLTTPNAPKERFHIPKLSSLGSDSGLDIHPYSQTLLMTGMESYTLWDIPSRRILKEFSTASSVGTTLAASFSPDGAFLVWGRIWDETIQIMDAQARQTLIYPFQVHDLYDLAFAPDSKILASYGWKTPIMLWDFDVSSWQTRACQIVNRNLTLEEWQQFMGDTPYRRTCPDLPIPGEEEAWYNKGVILQGQQKWDEAIKAFQKQVERTPKHGDAWNRLGNILQTQGRFDKAIEAYQSQLEVNTYHQQAWENLGDTLQKQSNTEEAIAAYEKQIEQRKWRVAEVYRKILELDPNYPDIWYKLGRVLSGDEAITAYRKQVEIQSDHHDAWYRLGKSYHIQKQYDKAIAAYRRQIEVRPDHADAWNALGDNFRAQEEWGNAIAAYQKQVEITPDHEKAWQNLGSTLYQQKNYAEAVAVFQNIVALNPDHRSAWNDLGNSLYQKQQWDEAIEAYRKQIEVVPSHYQAWNNIGNTYFQQEKFDEAAHAFQKQVEINPSHREAWNALGNVLYRQEKWDEALAAYQTQVEKTPKHGWAWRNIGKTFWKQGKLDEAIEAYQHQVDVTPDHTEAWNALGVALYEQEKLDDALRAFETLVEMKPDHQWVWYNIGYILQKQEKLEDAVSAYKKQLEIMPDDEKTVTQLYGIGKLLLEQDNADKALPLFQRVVEVKPGLEDVWYHLGVAYYKQDQWDEAITAFQQQLSLKPFHMKTLSSMNKAIQAKGGERK